MIIKVAAPSQTRGIGRGVKRVTELQPALPALDPGAVKVLRWRARLCKKIAANQWRIDEDKLRAERRWGQLYKAGEKAKGSPGNQHTGPVARNDGSKTLTDMGVSRNQSSRWQGLADIERRKFLSEKRISAMAATEKATRVMPTKFSPTVRARYLMIGRYIHAEPICYVAAR